MKGVRDTAGAGEDARRLNQHNGGLNQVANAEDAHDIGGGGDGLGCPAMARIRDGAVNSATPHPARASAQAVWTDVNAKPPAATARLLGWRGDASGSGTISSRIACVARPTMIPTTTTPTPVQNSHGAAMMRLMPLVHVPATITATTIHAIGRPRACALC